MRITVTYQENKANNSHLNSGYAKGLGPLGEGKKWVNTHLQANNVALQMSLGASTRTDSKTQTVSTFVVRNQRLEYQVESHSSKSRPDSSNAFVNSRALSSTSNVMPLPERYPR